MKGGGAVDGAGLCPSGGPRQWVKVGGCGQRPEWLGGHRRMTCRKWVGRHLGYVSAHVPTYGGSDNPVLMPGE